MSNVANMAPCYTSNYRGEVGRHGRVLCSVSRRWLRASVYPFYRAWSSPVARLTLYRLR